jgi:hypothetical protein
MDPITHGTHNAWMSHRQSWVKIGALWLTTTSLLPVPEIIDPVFAKTSQNARFLLSEYERFGLVFTKTRVYKFGHRSQCMDCRKYAISDIFCEKGFFKKFFNIEKLDVLCPGRFVIWTFCNMGIW